MRSDLGYKIGSYTDIDSDLRNRIWSFLNERKTIQKMINVSNLNRPAAEGIAHDLFNKFGIVFVDRVKMCIGYLIKQVMENNGFHWISKGHKLKQNPIFNKASKYSRRYFR